MAPATPASLGTGTLSLSYMPCTVLSPAQASWWCSAVKCRHELGRAQGSSPSIQVSCLKWVLHELIPQAEFHCFLLFLTQTKRQKKFNVFYVALIRIPFSPSVKLIFAEGAGERTVRLPARCSYPHACILSLALRSKQPVHSGL